MDSSAKSAASTKHVVIVGAGFAGLNCAKKLASDSSLRITLIDKNNYQQFQPLFYQVATGILSPENAAFNLRNVLFHHQNVDVKMSEVVSVDLATRTVKGKSGDTYQGDFLILSAGSEANFFGISGANKNAFPMYSLRDAEHLRSRLLELFEAADVKGGAAAGNNLHFLVVGAGATGVETAGAGRCRRREEAVELDGGAVEQPEPHRLGERQGADRVGGAGENLDVELGRRDADPAVGNGRQQLEHRSGLRLHVALA